MGSMDAEPSPDPVRVPEGTPQAGRPVPPALRSILAWARIDLAPRHRQPRWPLVALATAVAVAGSLAAAMLAVHVATTEYPATAHFSHFRVADYATLTVVGVLAACGAWPVVTRVTSAPRQLFRRLAVVATLLLWVPDCVLFALGQPAAGVLALMVMHLAIALVTYHALVRLAPVRRAPAGEASPAATPPVLGERAVRRLWNAMALLVALELVLGVGSIVSVPFRRPNTLLPARGTALYTTHAAVGLALAAGAVGVLVLSLLAGRMARIGAVLGGVGVLIGVAGGGLASYQQTRLLGMGVMMIGTVVAGIGYLVPAMEAMGKEEAAKAQAAREAMAKAQAPSGTGPVIAPAGLNGSSGVTANGHAGAAGGGSLAPPASPGG